MNFDSYRTMENVLFIMGQRVTSTHQQTSWEKIDYFQSKSLLSVSKTSTSQPSNTTPKYFLWFHLEMQSSCLSVEFLFPRTQWMFWVFYSLDERICCPSSSSFLSSCVLHRGWSKRGRLRTQWFIKCYIFSAGDRTLAASLEEMVGVLIHFSPVKLQLLLKCFV